MIRHIDYDTCRIALGGAYENHRRIRRNKMVKEEFPDDPALQQVHIARKIIAKEAEHEGLSYLEYIKSGR